MDAEKNRLWRGKTQVPNVWYWEEGRVRNSLDPIDFPYLHFLHWKEDWKVLPALLHADLETLKRGFRVERSGFYPLDAPPAGWVVELKMTLISTWHRLLARLKTLTRKSHRRPRSTG